MKGSPLFSILKFPNPFHTGTGSAFASALLQEASNSCIGAPLLSRGAYFKIQEFDYLNEHNNILFFIMLRSAKAVWWIQEAEMALQSVLD
jgi:hypothetical protein